MFKGETMMARLLRLTCMIASFLWLGAVNAQEKVDFDYKLGPGDQIRIVVFQNPDLTLDTRVAESGSITYPLIGTVAIGGLSIDAAEKQIAKGLKDGGFVQQPQVNIVLTQVRGNQISVLGMVNRPGRFPLETFNTKVSDMLATAGGIAVGGSDVVILSGVRNGKPYRKEVDFPAIFVEKKESDDVVVQGGDVLYVHRQPMFYVYGEAQRPGAYRVERGMTVQQALALGGGPTVRGMEWFLRLHRKDESGKLQRISPDWNDPIQADDVLYVRESLF